MIAMPFVLVFLYRQKTGWTRLGLFVAVFAAVYAAIVAPYALTSQAFREMVFNSPEQKKLFAFAVPVSSSLSIVICPMVTVLIFFKFVSYKKLNREIFLMFLGLVFACLVIFVPPMPGWFLWSLPFLIYFYLSNRDYSRAPFVFYNIVYLFYFLFFFEKQPHFAFRSMDAKTVENLAMSVTMASVGFIALWMFRLGIERNEALKAKEAPLLIGIGGDSASGKHTTYHILRTLVGKDKSIPIFGDDFHKWERGNEMWNVYTHLNPSGNKLHEEMEAAVALRDGGTIQMGRYDHKSGTFSSAATVEASKFVFFVGLHPFYLKKMRDLIAIKIFMDTDESLRRYWKIRRDVKKRGYQKDKVLEQLESREQDSEKFIRPQAKFADLVIRMEPAGPIDAESGPRRAALRTRYIMDNSVPTDLLLAALSKIKTLSVATAHDMDTQEIEIAGTVTAREIMEAAFGLGLNFDELLVKTNRWLSGHYGVTQLIFLLLYQFKMKAR
jgi:uridine kinase